MNLIRGAIRPSFRVGHSSLEVCTPKSLLVHGWLLKATPADVKSNPRVMRRMKSDQSRAWVRLSDFRIGPSRHHHGSAPLTSVRDICLGFIICTSPASRSPNRHGVSVSVTGVTMSVLCVVPQNPSVSPSLRSAPPRTAPHCAASRRQEERTQRQYM